MITEYEYVGIVVKYYLVLIGWLLLAYGIY